MTTPAPPPITDAINGLPVTVQHNRHWICLGYDSAEDAWLTATGALRLAAELLKAADAVIAADAVRGQA